MKPYIIAVALLASIGCNGVKRLVDGPTNQPLQETNINPNDYYYTGTATTDHDDVHYTDSKVKLADVEVFVSGNWKVLERLDVADSYRAFIYPSTGIVFGNLAWTDAQGQHYTSDPACPTGTQYRLHLVAK